MSGRTVADDTQHLEPLTRELSGIVGAENVELQAVHDLWPLALIRERSEAGEARLVVRPGDPGEVADVLRFAGVRGIAVVPMGAASGVCGAVSPDKGQLVLDLRRLDRILAIDEDNLICVVEAGVVGLRLEERLNERGLTLGHFPSSLPISTVGGLISTRSSGQQSSFHGNIEDLLLGVVALRADGSRLSLRPGPRSAVGPALHQLFVGAEGAVGVIVEAELRVRRRPAAVQGRGYAFASVDDGLRAMREVMQVGIAPFVMRLYDAADTAFQGLGVEGLLLVVATAGETAVASAQAEVVARVMDRGRPLGEGPWTHWLDHRFDLSVERLREFLRPQGAFVDTIELATTWTRMPSLYTAVRSALADADVVLCHFSHASAQGCCAYFTFGGFAESDGDAQRRYEATWDAAMHAALAEAATISHHHGVGRLRAPWVREEMGEWWGFWQDVRAALDPGGILNPNAVGGR